MAHHPESSSQAALCCGHDQRQPCYDRIRDRRLTTSRFLASTPRINAGSCHRPPSPLNLGLPPGLTWAPARSCHLSPPRGAAVSEPRLRGGRGLFMVEGRRRGRLRRGSFGLSSRLGHGMKFVPTGRWTVNSKLMQQHIRSLPVVQGVGAHRRFLHSVIQRAVSG